ncbi:MAG TPA: DNA internalization-related competence protein ComEC/Rec2, partial [Bacteroidota bacterium]
FFKGLVIGDRQGISTEWKEAFVDAGVMHILAVSGLNVGLVAGMFFAFAGLVRLPRFWRVAATVVGLVFYAALTGFAPPVVRATIMAVVVLLGSLLERRVDPYHSLAVAALIMLFVDARQLFDPGFQLSFAAAFSIVYPYPMWAEVCSRLPRVLTKNVFIRGGMNLIVLSFAAQLGTLPFILLYFGKVSVVALVVNPVVIPLTTLAIPLGFLMLLSNLFSPSLAALYGEAARLLLSLTMSAVSIAAHFRWSSVTLPALGTNAVFCYYGLLLSAIRWNFRLARRTAVFVSLATLTIFIWTADVSAVGSRTMSVTVLDVSQGDAICVEFPFGQTMLIDAGPRSQHSDAGKERIVPFLERRGIQFIDAVILTHPHSDHLGGLATILSSVRVGRVIYSGKHTESDAFERFVAAAWSYGVPLQTVEAGDTLGGFTMARCYVLHPVFDCDDGTFRRAGSSLNDGSVVLKLLYGKTSFLFAGDVERDGERQLLGRYGNFLDSDVLKVAHHGSESSSTQSFLGIVSPHTAIVSVGRFNLFGHPSQDVLSRLREHHCQVHRTDLEGAVVVRSDGERALVADWH